MPKLKLPRRSLFVIFLASIAIILIAAGYIVVRGIRAGRVRGVVHLGQSNRLEYRVFLKQNPYIDKQSLGMEENYLHTYTDYISLRTEYSLYGNMESGDVEWLVTANLVSRYNKSPGAGGGNPEIFTKEYVLERDSAALRGGAASFDRTFTLRLEPYIKELDEFGRTVDIAVANEIRVDITAKVSGGDVSDTYIRGITIPVSYEFYNIATHGESSVARDYNVTEKPLSVWTAIGLTLLMTAAVFLALLSGARLLDKRPPYEREVAGYLRAYADLIIRTQTTVDFNQYKTVKVSSMKELANLAQRTQSPIMVLRYAAGTAFYIIREDLLFLLVVADPQNKPQETAGPQDMPPGRRSSGI